MRYLLILFCLFCTMCKAWSQTTTLTYLSGIDKDSNVLWDFFVTDGRNSGQWTKIRVPSNWELQGFGTYNYGHDAVKAGESGIYQHEFSTGELTGKRVYLVFEGSMTDTKVTVNGKSAGPVHQGAFYRFKYDITELLNPAGKNLLKVTVDKTSSNTSVNMAERKSDYWIFGGIYRPVYLETVPEVFIERVAIDARADGSFQVDVYPKNLKGGETIEAQIQSLDGKNLGASMQSSASMGQPSSQLKTQLQNIAAWSPESPKRYQVIVSLKQNGKVIHTLQQKFGFRTVELRKNEGLYVNGQKIILKGSNRHSFWPESGRTLSHDIHVMDVKLMKEMNMNAVRMSHYPPDQDFLDVCDSLGLYVINELAGWQAAYDTEAGSKLVEEMVIRDVNHPSILLWANGNEDGWNTALDGLYGQYDPQNRTVIHPRGNINGTVTKHYPTYSYVAESVANEKDVFFPTEFMHGLYDGGAGAALDDFWKLIMQHPRSAGGFIWAFVDEAVIRTDKGGIFDSDGNHGADGILGPHREKEASYYTIKEIWSPVYIEPKPIDDQFRGIIPLENRYAFTNLNQCSFEWKLVDFKGSASKNPSSVKARGKASVADLKPGESGTLSLNLPAGWRKHDALYLTAYGPDNQELFTWSWAIHPPELPFKNVNSAKSRKSSITENPGSLIIHSKNISYHFDKTTGFLEKVVKSGGPVSLSGGPALAGVKTELSSFSHRATSGGHQVEASYQGSSAMLKVKWTLLSGQAARLEYEYAQQGELDYRGITFNYPESQITGMKWLGRGPYKVWQNRLKGQQFGIWEKAYNNSITGESFGYPEFKGYHAEVNWVEIQSKESPIRVYTTDKNMYLQMLHPGREQDALVNNNVEPPFPAGDIGFMKAIPAIGTKFKNAKLMGPQSQKTPANNEWLKGTLWFDFGENTPGMR